jgi:hypothetical protein
LINHLFIEIFNLNLENIPSSLTQSQSNSVQKNLKLQLLSLLRLPASTEHQQTIGKLLLDIGASNQEVILQKQFC